jgi:iron(II)-dependent oxidoreductase
MVCVPAGEFTLGSSVAQMEAWLKEYPQYERKRFAGAQPQCRVNLPRFWIGRTEITNAQYLRFVRAAGHRAPDHWKGGQIPSGQESFPVAYVSWEDADAYARWADGRLPSELEWEKAARGADGRVFPWGDQWDDKRCRNIDLILGRKCETVGQLASALRSWTESHHPVSDGPAAVGAYAAGASPYGCLDMAGNVWEWCADWYDEKAYPRYAKGDLAPPRSGTSKVLRGGSWDYPNPTGFLCTYYRHHSTPDDRSDFNVFSPYGFRCARDPE